MNLHASSHIRFSSSSPIHFFQSWRLLLIKIDKSNASQPFTKSNPHTTALRGGSMAPRRCMAAAVMLLAMMASTWAVASPNGLGAEANEGCLCHTPDTSTSIEVAGLPESFVSNQTYNLTLIVTSSIDPVENRSQGGFRLLVDEGEIVLNNDSAVQELESGYTHTNEGSMLRTWNLVWQAPLENDTAATFTVHGNAVNGNNAATGDAWATVEVLVPGEAYEGDLTAEEGIDGVSQTDRLILVVGLVILVGLLWSVGRP